MAIISDANAVKFSPTIPIPGVYEKTQKVEQFVGALDFKMIDASEVSILYTPSCLYNGEDKLVGVVTASGAAQYTVSLDVDEARVLYNPSTLNGDVKISQFQKRHYAGIQEMANELVAKRRKAGLLALGEELIIGPGTSNRTYGLKQLLADSGNAVDAGQSDLSFSFMNEALRMHKANNGQPDYIVMGEVQLEKFRNLAGNNPRFKRVPHLNHEVITFMNIPILQSDFVGDFTGSPNYDEVYFLTLGWEKGIGAYFPRNEQKSLISVEMFGKTDEYLEVYRVSLTAGLVMFTTSAISGITDLPTSY